MFEFLYAILGKKRIHFVEFHELAWFPKNIRTYMTDILSMMWTTGLVSSFHALVMPHLKEAMNNMAKFFVVGCRNSTIQFSNVSSGTNEIVDLCSGSGGPLLHIQRDMKRYEQFEVKVTLTDLFLPNDKVRREIADRSQGTVKYYKAPVDATDVPQELSQGFSTMFCSFHHMTETGAAAILQDAINKKRGIGIFEMQERSLFSILMSILMNPLSSWFLMPFTRPFSLDRILWTYIIPIVPIVFMIDGKPNKIFEKNGSGVTSCLRTYSPAELEAMIHSLKGHETYEWKIIQQKRRDTPPARAIMLIGTPKS